MKNKILSQFNNLKNNFRSLIFHSENPYSNIIRYGLLCVFILSIILGWSSKEIQNTALIQIIIFSLFLFDQLDGLKNRRFNEFNKTLLFLLIIVFISNITNSVYFFNTYIEITKISSFLLFFYLVVKYFNNKDIFLFFKIIILIGLFVGIYGLVDIILLKDIGVGIASFFGWRNTLGGVIILLFPVSFAYFLSEKNKKWKTLSFAVSAILLINLYFTFSQASWLAFIISFCCFLFFLFRYDFKKYLVKIGLLFALIIFAVMLLLWFKENQYLQKTSGDDFIKKALQESQVSTFGASNRLYYWMASIEIFKDHPIFGIGLGNFSIIMTQYQRELWTYTADPHNVFLLILSEAGILGVTLALFLSYLVIKKICFLCRNIDKTKTEYILFIGLITGIIGSLLHNLLDFDWQIDAILLLWILLIALMFVLSAEKFKQEKTEDKRFLHIFNIFLLLLMIISLSSIVFSEFYFQRLEKNRGEISISEEENLAKKSVLFNPFLDKNYRNLALVYAQKYKKNQGDLEENKKLLIKYSQKAIDLSPQDGFNYFFLADSFFFIKKDDDDLKPIKNILEKALLLDKYNRSEVYDKLITTYLFMEEKDKALKLIDVFLEIYSEKNLSKMFLSEDRSLHHKKLINKIKKTKERLNTQTKID